MKEVSLNDRRVKISLVLLIFSFCFVCFLTSKMHVFPDSGGSGGYEAWNGWFGCLRPFVYPAILQILQLKQLVLFQYVIYASSGIFLCFSAMKIFSRGSIVFVPAFILYAFSPYLISWNSCVLTEGINFSLWFLLAAVILLQFKSTQKSYVVSVVVIVFLLVFLKYSNVVPVLFLAPMYLLLLIKSKHRPIVIVLTVTCIFVMFDAR